MKRIFQPERKISFEFFFCVREIAGNFLFAYYLENEIFTKRFNSLFKLGAVGNVIINVD